MNHMEILFMVLNHGLRIAYLPYAIPGLEVEPCTIEHTLGELVGYDGEVIRRNKSAADFHFYKPDVDRIEGQHKKMLQDRETTLTFDQLLSRWPLTNFEVEALLHQEGIEPVDPVGQSLDDSMIIEYLYRLGYISTTDLLYRKTGPRPATTRLK